ncbi:MAG TPA: type II toxin-antitoxin system HicA family toxin [Bacilli bacterium]
MSSWKDLKSFCERDGWEMIKKGSDHWRYRKVMPDGSVKYTRVSHGTGEIGKELFARILKEQLQVTKEYFNSVKY